MAKSPATHGQAALDFLMTYGWALLIITLVISMIAALNFFDLGTFVGNRASGFAQVSPVGWKMDVNGNFFLVLKNNVGTDIIINRINATMGTSTVNYTGSTYIANGAQNTTPLIGPFPNSPAYSQSYSVKVNIQYNDTSTGQSYLDSGIIYGRVST